MKKKVANVQPKVAASKTASKLEVRKEALKKASLASKKSEGGSIRNSRSLFSKQNKGQVLKKTSKSPCDNAKSMTARGDVR